MIFVTLIRCVTKQHKNNYKSENVSDNQVFRSQRETDQVTLFV